MFSAQKVLKWSGAAAGAGLGSALGYVYLTSPSKVPFTSYRNLEPVKDRSEHIKRLKSDTFDLIVIGGGATGASVAMDGASRGLKVALIEKDDFASGTSSRSTKLLHGGVRYLREAVFKADLKAFKMVYEALQERAHMLHSHQYLCHPVGMILPTYTYFDLLQYWVGVKMYDWFAKVATLFNTGVPDSFYINKQGCMHAFPLLKSDHLKGGVFFYDGQQNDSRVNVAIAMTAATPHYLDGWNGAVIANHISAESFTRDENDKLSGVVCKDTISQDSFTVKGAVVLNCTGPYADTIRKMANPDSTELIVTSSGSHVILPKLYASENIGMLIPETGDGRVLFSLPWEDHTCVGTTDVKTSLTDKPAPTQDEVEFIVKETCKYVNIKAEDVKKDIKAAWSGLRPLVKDPNATDTSKFSRDFEIVIDQKSGLISVLGGKWTTCRLMAERAVDSALKQTPSLKPTHKCRTWGLKLIGSHSPTSLQEPTQLSLALQREFGLNDTDASYMARNYGIDAIKICQDSHKAILPNQSFRMGELRWAFEQEMAVTVVDAIARRSRIAFVDPDHLRLVLPALVDHIGTLMQWDTNRRLKELDDTEAFLKTMEPL